MRQAARDEQTLATGNRNSARWLLGILLVALVVRVAAVLVFQALPSVTLGGRRVVSPAEQPLFPDALEYLKVTKNILLGREVSEQDLDRALQVSRLAQDLPAFPDGLDTMVGERGVKLSGGQQQRVALARALVGCPSILLLDDATAALDADTEAAFWEQLETVLPEIGAVVVTHRVATIQRADRVLVLEGGRIVQEGTHDDLIGADGAYRRVYGRYEAREKLRKL